MKKKNRVCPFSRTTMCLGQQINYEFKIIMKELSREFEPVVINLQKVIDFFAKKGGRACRSKNNQYLHQQKLNKK
jgi:hypothetical protein